MDSPPLSLLPQRIAHYRGRRTLLDKEEGGPRGVGGDELHTMERPEDYALNFEAVKTSFRQTKDGYHLTLVLHPNDVPPDLFSSWVGSRYQCCLVQMNDENEPVKTADGAEADALVQQAAMLCRSNRFQAWVCEYLGHPPEERDVWGDSEEDYAARLLRSACRISSRSELRTNLEARRAFKDLCNAFMEEVDEEKNV